MGAASNGLFMIVLFAFVAGIAVGWFFGTARIRLGGSMRVSTAPPEATPGICTNWSGEAVKSASKARTMELRCKCGSVWKFRDPPEPGFEPFPVGDSFSCPKCGFATDLRRIRKLVQDARA